MGAMKAIPFLAMIAVMAALFVTPIGIFIIFIRWLHRKVTGKPVGGFNTLLTKKEIAVLFVVGFVLLLVVSGLGTVRC